ncbi:LmeA family phospholipid-binding protein [Streptomyces sp. bgisy084]|uniref:LmeA family phospholipid-binding protein n=1 Tax=unclassified Streptomyces TaxID=2593676 RepID=UPI003D7480D3
MRALRVLLILVVIFGGLFVAADRVAVGLAEDKAAEKIRGSQGLDRTPTVAIKGFPFLTQVAGRSLQEVDADLGGIEARAQGRALRIDQLTAHFFDVGLTSDYTSIESAASATGNARITYADLTKAAGGGVKIGFGGQKNGRSQVKISPKIPVLSSLEVTGSITIVGGDTVRLRADGLPGMCRALPGCEAKVRAQTDHDWKLDQLPANLKLDKVVTMSQGLSISASGKNVKLPG